MYDQYVWNSDLNAYPLLTTFNNQDSYNYKFMDTLSGRLFGSYITLLDLNNVTSNL